MSRVYVKIYREEFDNLMAMFNAEESHQTDIVLTLIGLWHFMKIDERYNTLRDTIRFSFQTE